MNSLYQSYLAAVIRWVITLAVGYAIKHGADASAANGLAAGLNPTSIAAAVGGIVTIAWSIWHKNSVNTNIAVAAATGISTATPTTATAAAVAPPNTAPPTSIPKVPIAIIAFALICLAAGTPGCATSGSAPAISSTNGVLYVFGNAVTTNAVQADLQTLASTGATYAISKDSNAKAYFEAANVVLTVLVNSTNYSSSNLQSALSTISVNGIKDSANVQSIISGIVTLYAATEAQAIEAKVDSVAYLGAALRGINAGFNQALGQ